jgi:hypothetical protein
MKFGAGQNVLGARPRVTLRPVHELLKRIARVIVARVDYERHQTIRITL